MLVPRALLFSLLAVMACSYRPARFGHRPLALVVGDNEPIAVPKKRVVIEELYQASVYVRRELVNALDPRRPNEAADINALDEVPASSWFQEPAWFETPLKGYKRDGAPHLPMTALAEPAASQTPGARVIVDARGLRYELLPDIRGRPGMRTGAAATASRLLFALGYRTPEVHIITTPQGERLAATRWPIGLDLGPTPIDHQRPDDPNDLIDHRDRRTLRALKLVTAWLDIKRLPPRMLRDAYLGEAGEGHVQHFLVGTDGALGVDRYREAVQWLRNPDREDANFFLRLFSLGLSPKPSASPPDTTWPSVGLLEHFVMVEHFAPSPPFEPIDRLQAADAYWIAKRIAAIPDRVLGRAVLSSKLAQPEQYWLLQLLQQRRAQIVAWGYDRVTPLEPVELVPADRDKQRLPELWLSDRAVHSRMMTPERSSYRVRFVGRRGEEVASTDQVRPIGSRVVVSLPDVLRQGNYVVLQITGFRDGLPLPRAVEIHLRPRGDGYALAGVRH